MTMTVEKVGSEFLVNTQTAGTQHTPAITYLPNGGFVICWWDYSGTLGDASGTSIKAQLFDATGGKLGSEFLVNTQTVSDQSDPSIASLSNGGFVLSWQDRSGTLGDVSMTSTKAQIFDANGAKVGNEFLVNTETANNQTQPTVTGLSSGNFVVSWTDYSGQGGDASPTSVKAQIFSASGAKLGTEFLVNTQTTSSQSDPTIAGLANGGFVVSWTDYSGLGGDASQASIKAQIFDQDGIRVGDEFLVNTVTQFTQYVPSVAVLDSGNFIITWIDSSIGYYDPFRGYFVYDYEIKAQIFTETGSKIGNEFRVNTTTSGDQFVSVVAPLATGGFVISWTDNSGNSARDIKAQLFDPSGVKVGTEFLVNTLTGSDEAGQTITSLSNGGFVVSWMQPAASLGDGSGSSIKAQIFSVTPDNAPPMIDGGAAAAFDVAENTTAVASFTATDPDAGDTVAWTLGGDDAGLFSIDDAGNLAFAAAPDFEAPADLGGDNVYNLTVIASDGDASDSQQVIVTVTDTTTTDTLVLDGAFPEQQTVQPSLGFGFGRIIGVGNNDTVSVGLPGGALSVGASLDGSEITLDWDADAITDLSISGVPDLIIYASAVTVSGDLSATGLSPYTIAYFGDDDANSFDASLLTSNESIEARGFGGNDTLIGSGGQDFLLGGADDDLLRGLDGLDYLVGGSGVDTASYAGIIAGIAATASGWEVGDGTANDQLDGVEIVDDAAAGKYLLVGNGGFSTIQAAVDAADAGDTVIVHAGTYAESVALNKAVTLQGANAGITGTGARGTESIIQGQVTISADAVLDGFQILNTSANGVAFFGVSVTGAADATIANTVFFSTGINGQTGAGEDRAINLDTTASGNIAITGNLFTGAALANFSTASWARGIWSDGAAETLDIDGNSFSWVRSAINLDGYEDSRTSVNNNDFIEAGSGISIGIPVGPAVNITDFSLNSFGNVGTDFNLQNIGAGNSITLALNGTGSLPVPGQPMTVLLGQGNDVYSGTSRVDIVVGNGGDDLIFGGADNDVLIGGAGIDRALYADSLVLSQLLAIADFDAVTPGNQPGWQVTSGIDGTDVLSGIEIVDGNEAGRFLLVGSGGFATIQAAVDAATPGDTILVAAGSYAENVTITKAVTLLGANTGIAGSGVRGAESSVLGAFTVAADGVTIDGFGFDGGASAIRGQAGAIAYDNLTITNNRIANTTDSAIRFGLGSGGGAGSENWLISDNQIDAINGNALTGMVLFNVAGLMVTDNVINHNLASVTGRRGINLDGVQDATISGNTLDMGLVAPTDATAASAATPWAIQLAMSDRVVSNVDVTGNTIGGSATGIVGLSQRSMVDVDLTGNSIANVINGIVLNGGSVSPVVPGVTMDVDVTGNTISAAINAVFVRDLHGAAANGPVVFDGLDVTGNTVTQGVVQIGRAETFVPTGASGPGNGLINITGTVHIDGTAGADTVQVEGSGAVVVDAGGGADTLIGGAGNDSFAGGGGADSVDGGAGDDTVSLAGNWADYAIGLAGGAYTLTGADGPDVVRNVENYVFADGTLGVAEILNDAPFALAFADVAIAENTVAGTELGTATASDIDTLDTLSFSLSDDAGGRFVIDAATGVVSVAIGAVLDREAAASHAITVAVTDLGGLTTEVDALVTLTDVDEFNVSLPADTDPAANSVAEGAVAGIVVGVVVAAVDADATTSAVSYALTDSAGGRFAINATTGVITVLDGSLLDFETATSHDVEVTASSTDGSTSVAAFTIAVANVVEPQFFIGTSAAETFTAPTDDDWTVDARGGADTITTAGGDDSVAAGLGNDIIATGGGNDIILFKGNSSANGFDTINGGTGTDELRALANNTIISLASVTGIEVVSANGFSNVVVQGSGAANVLDFTGAMMTGIVAVRGGGGTDTITGSLSADIIRGDAGNDILAGSDGDDSFHVGLNHGQDSIDGGDGFDSVLAIANNTRIGIASHTGLEAISANGFANVTLIGTTAANLLDFSGVTLSGIVAIDAGGGNDSIIGSAGADVIKAGAGIDTLTGGAGADIFDFDLLTDSRTGGAYDVISDFEIGIDRIDLSSIDANTAGAAGNQDFSFIGSAAFSNTAGEVRFDTSLAGITRIFGDTDGNGVANFEIQLTGTLVLAATDFIA